MKKRSFLFIGVVSGVLWLTSFPVSAQRTTLLKADIPFEFTLGKSTLPAGEYTFRLLETSGSPIVSAKGTDGRSYAMALTNWVNWKKSAMPEGLTFVRSGDGYHLLQVRVAGRELGQEIVQSRKAAASGMARRTVALKAAGNE